MSKLQSMSKEELVNLAQSLETENIELKNQNELLKGANKEFELNMDLYKEQIKLLKKGRFTASSEKTTKLPLEQLSLFNESEHESNPQLEEPTLKDILKDRETTSQKPRKSTKMNINEITNREVIEYDLSDEEKRCDECGAPLRKIGEDTREEVVYVHAHVRVKTYKRMVYACRECELNGEKTFIKKTEFPTQVIPKSVASAELVSSIIYDKYTKALPLYRQEWIFEELGLTLSRQTMSNWILSLNELYFDKMVSFMNLKMMQCQYLLVDETTVQVLKELRHDSSESKSYIWPPPIEKKLKNKSYDEILAIRQVKSKPIVEEIFDRAKVASLRAVSGTRLAEALTYLLNQEEHLKYFLEDGRVELSTNRVERAIKPFAIGRRNWLFSNTTKGAEASASIYSIVETAKMNHLQVYDYLVYILNQLPNMDLDNETELERIMPWSKELPLELYKGKKSYV